MQTAKQNIRLGIDTKWYFKGPPSGHMVVKNLVDEIVKEHPGIDLFLLLDSRCREQASNLFPANVTMLYLPPIPNLLANMFCIPVVAKKHKLDAVVFQNFSSLGLQNIAKIAYVHDVLFLDMPQYYTYLERLYFKQMCRLAKSTSMILTISESEKQRMVAHEMASPEKINVVYHGINSNFKPLQSHDDLKIQAVIEKYGLPERYLLFVGRVNVRKNLLNLIIAMQLIKDDQVPLIIVGEESSLTIELTDIIQQKGLSHRIKFTGHVPEADLYIIYAKATVFCFPSFAEGFGLPPLEAMQCGVPTLVANRTAMPEVCGDAALYIDPDDVNDIAAKIDLLFNDPVCHAEKAKAGLVQAAKYSWQQSAKQILHLIGNAYDHRKTYQEA